jgi:hypothetical protein
VTWFDWDNPDALLGVAERDVKCVHLCRVLSLDVEKMFGYPLGYG